jgi:uncharacterized SAM-binding protein YcdF (DUF218 family)
LTGWFARAERWLAAFLLLAFVLVLLYVFRAPLLTWAGSWVMREDPVKPADAVVLLAAAFPRGVLEAADLYHAKKAPRILFTEERLPDGLEELRRRGAKVEELAAIQSRVLKELKVSPAAIVVLKPRTEGTLQEAKVVARYLKCHGEIRSLILVARRPQTGRAKRTFERVLGKRIKVAVTASKYDEIRPDNWWKDTWYLREVSEEFLKHAYDGLRVVLPLPER